MPMQEVITKGLTEWKGFLRAEGLNPNLQKTLPKWGAESATDLPSAHDCDDAPGNNSASTFFKSTFALNILYHLPFIKQKIC